MKILVVVDMQNDFITGALGTPEAQTIVPKVVEKIRSFDGDKIYYTMDTHFENYLDTQEGKLLPIEHCIADSQGWKLHSDVRKALIDTEKDHMYFEKSTFGAVDLGKYLSHIHEVHQCIDEIVLVGLCTDICVISNAILLKAFLPEAKITVDAACCAGTTPESHTNALAAMKVCQINVM